MFVVLDHPPIKILDKLYTLIFYQLVILLQLSTFPFRMALLGFQFVITLVVALFLQKLSPFYSFARWIMCSKLYRYLHPTNEQLRARIGKPALTKGIIFFLRNIFKHMLFDFMISNRINSIERLQIENFVNGNKRFQIARIMRKITKISNYEKNRKNFEVFLF